jgi:hypothetical protein
LSKYYVPDFNLDGKIDANDYVGWRKALATVCNQDDYNN